MKTIDCGTKQPDYGSPQPATSPATPKKMKTVYPSVTINKLVKPGMKYGDEFEATVRFRVLEVASGRPYSDAKVADRTTLEVISITPGMAKSKTAMREGHAQSVIEDAIEDQHAMKGEGKGDVD